MRSGKEEGEEGEGEAERPFSPALPPLPHTHTQFRCHGM